MNGEETLESIGSLKKQVKELETAVEKLTYLGNEKDQKIELQKAQINDLLRRIYGRRSERFEDPNQKTLFDYIDWEGSPQKEEEKEELQSFTTKRRKPKKRGPKPLPEHLERERVEIDPPEGERTCACCGEAMQRVEEVVTEELDVIPPQFRVKQYVRGKWICPDHMNGAIMAPLPPRPIERGRPSPRLLAYIVTSKYCDHQPLYRQEQIFKRHGIELSRKTIDGWLGELSGLLLPVVLALKRQLFLEPFLQMDDTPIQVLDKTVKGKSRHCYIWAYAIPGREVVYDFTESRSARGPVRFLEGYEGQYIQCDEYSGNLQLFKSGKRERIACMAHIRRKFFEAKQTAPERVEKILALIRNLYEIEDEAKDRGLSPAGIVELRRKSATPLLAALKKEIDELEPRTTPKSKLGRAVSYAQKNWPAMLRYVEVGFSPIDNNSCENTIRPVVLGRKNFLFLGSTESGGERTEVFYSLIQSCRRLGFDPFRYLADVIERISTHPAARIEELTPRGWKEALERAEKEAVRTAR